MERCLACEAVVSRADYKGKSADGLGSGARETTDETALSPNSDKDVPGSFSLLTTASQARQRSTAKSTSNCHLFRRLPDHLNELQASSRE